MSKPTTLDQHAAYQALYDFFNRELALGLAPVLLNFSRQAKAYGFFAPDRWVAGKSTRHEISLNPNYLDRDHKATCATLVHEMVHAWQAEHGKPSRGGYHNREWAERMESVGLMPSTTGDVGGAKVGARVTHYIVRGGAFERVYAKIPKAMYLPWLSSSPAEAAPKAKPVSKVKYTCPECEANAWGKPGLNLLCGDCDARFDACEATG